MKQLFAPTLAALALLALSGCGSAEDYSPLKITESGGQLFAQGVIDASTPDVIQSAIDDHPQARTLVLNYVPGSVDDVANLEASRLLRRNGFTTIVPADGMVASGGTDMFLAGVERAVQGSACIGVHSWATGGLFGSVEGIDVPKDDPQHQLYLSYYAEMGIDAAFYWYTLEAADAENIHYMSKSEMNAYSIATAPLDGGPDATDRSCAAIEARFGFS